MVSPPEDHPRHSRRHTIVIWTVLLALLIGAFAATVAILNATVFSAGGFVGSYLSALQRHDLREALTTSGVLGSARAESDLLVPEALGALDDIHLVSDLDQGAGVHLVTYEFELGGAPGSSAFQVQSTGPRLGFFSTWSFVQSPMAVLRITPLHDPAFTVNGVEVVSAAGANNQVAYQVLAPGLYVVDHESRYLEADAVPVAVTGPSSVTPVTVDIQASADFVEQVQKEVDGFLDDCTTQTVLFPTGCPFGQELSNRVVSTPAWSMARYPEVVIEPGPDPGTWVIPNAQGAAHLTVDVQSLFDGTQSTFDEDVQFALSWVLTIDGDQVDIRAQ
ncbi:hypothetical protein GCM10022239_03100 [Leifsonia bigeumensis]|uniref:Uncharacterized protein n=1 Tax=Leifsonella bigeumensis TaxID=433643 RepID=A0ABP7F431_9MICO